MGSTEEVSNFQFRHWLESARNSRSRRLLTGQTLFDQGEMVTHAYLLGSGVVRLWTVGPQGREVTLAYRGPLEPVRWSFALASLPSPVTASAVSDSQFWPLPRKTVWALAGGFPVRLRELVTLICWEAAEFANRFVELTCLNSSDRLALLLQSSGNEDRAVEAFPSAQIASTRPMREWAAWIGVTPEHLSRLTRALRQSREEGEGYGSMTFTLPSRGGRKRSGESE